MATERGKEYLKEFAKIYTTIKHYPQKTMLELGVITKQIRPLLEKYPEFREHTESLFATATDEFREIQKRLKAKQLIKKREKIKIGFKWENGKIRIRKMPI